MVMTLKQYLEKYLKILKISKVESTVPPTFWVFSTWQVDSCVQDLTPKQASKVLYELQESDPGLYEVCMIELDKHVENMREQESVQKAGGNVFDVVKVANRREIIPVDQAIREAEELLARFV